MMIPAIMAAMAAQEAVSCPMRMSTTTRPMPINDATWDQVRWLGGQAFAVHGHQTEEKSIQKSQDSSPDDDGIVC